MSDFKLVIGDAEKVRGGRYMAAPIEDGGEWRLRPAVRSPIERLRRWWKREPSGQSLRIALWLEMDQPACNCKPADDQDNYLSHSRLCHALENSLTDVRIDLCLHHSPAPAQCVLLHAVPRVVQWSFAGDDRMHAAIQTLEYPVYPTTHNFIGIIEMRWPRDVRLSERDFRVHYGLFSTERPVADTRMIEGEYSG